MSSLSSTTRMLCTNPTPVDAEGIALMRKMLVAQGHAGIRGTHKGGGFPRLARMVHVRSALLTPSSPPLALLRGVTLKHERLERMFARSKRPQPSVLPELEFPSNDT